MSETIQNNLPLAWFYVLSAIILGCCLTTATQKNIVHCAMSLAAAFFCVAGIFILLDAEFMAAIQVIIYVGAIAILILFAVMLSEKVEGGAGTRHQTSQKASAAVATALFAIITISIIRGHAWTTVENYALAATGHVKHIGLLLLQPYVIPFEVASVLLLAAMIGAIVVARQMKEEGSN